MPRIHGFEARSGESARRSAHDLPIARKVGITKKIGWHAFRRTYSSLLAATGDDVKVVQGLMRHAKISTIMEVDAQGGMEKKRAVDVLLDRKLLGLGAK